MGRFMGGVDPVVMAHIGYYSPCPQPPSGMIPVPFLFLELHQKNILHIYTPCLVGGLWRGKGLNKYLLLPKSPALLSSLLDTACAFLAQLHSMEGRIGL